MKAASFVVFGSPSAQIVVAPPLGVQGATFWPQANNQILWGWKRDSGMQSRTVYFSGVLKSSPQGVLLCDSFFYYRHRTKSVDAVRLIVALRQAIQLLKKIGVYGRPCITQDQSASLTTINFNFGVGKPADVDRVSRLILRRRRIRIDPGHRPDASVALDALHHAPYDLYAGSGLSYEAGLPTLCQVHDFFCVDNHATREFTYGISDQLPRWIAEDPDRVLKTFCELHLKALHAFPTRAQRIIAQLHRSRQIGKVFSDNVDNMFAKVGLPFERTRGSGVFNERYPAVFENGALLVVGVAADRRQIIQQARGKGMKIIVVDSCAKVSHGVQHLNYMRRGDMFIRTTADEFFSAIAPHLIDTMV